jgi:hypothetical protein
MQRAEPLVANQKLAAGHLQPHRPAGAYRSCTRRHAPHRTYGVAPAGGRPVFPVAIKLARVQEGSRLGVGVVELNGHIDLARKY